MIKIILVILIYLPFSYFSQILTKKQESAIKNTIASQFGEQFAKNINLNLGSTNFQNLAGDTLFNPDGLNYVFKLTSDTLLRLDQSIFHGADNNRFLFTYNNKLYALGGYGHFTTNNNLKQFNFTNHEWQFVSCQGETPPFILGPAYVHGQYLYSFNNFKGGNNVEKDLTDTNAYRLNLETKQWQRVYNNLLIKHNIERRWIYYTKDFIILLYNLYSIVINVKLNAIITINNE